jgi:hypothetical protein
MDEKEIKDGQSPGEQERAPTTYPSGKALLPAMAAIYVAVFLVAVVRSHGY